MDQALRAADHPGDRGGLTLEPPRLLHTQAQAAARLGLSVPTFVKLVRPSIKRVYVGSAVRYPERELERWVERNSEAL